MQIWVDADACPGVIKEILFRAATRHSLPLILVANQWLRVPPSPWIRAVQVAQGFDVADSHIVEQAAAGDLVITADIPLAALVIDKQAFALNPRGEFYSAENIRQVLDMRNFMDSLRSSGVETGGPPAFNHADRQNFANQLDRFIARHGKLPRERIDQAAVPPRSALHSRPASRAQGSALRNPRYAQRRPQGIPSPAQPET
jgi:uncharacterized protein YaiI (UPF0178 family)